MYKKYTKVLLKIKDFHLIGTSLCGISLHFLKCTKVLKIKGQRVGNECFLQKFVPSAVKNKPQKPQKIETLKRV